MKNRSLAVTRNPRKKQKKMSRKSLAVPFSNSEHLPAMDPNKHYQISNDTRHPQDISRMLGEYYDDPATKVHTESSSIPARCSLL